MSLTDGAGGFTPIAPIVGSSRKFVQRSSVLLPDPDLPMRQIVSDG